MLFLKRRMKNTKHRFEEFVSSAFKHTTREIALLTQLDTLIGEPSSWDNSRNLDRGGVRVVATEPLEFQFPKSTHIYEIPKSFGAPLCVYTSASPKSVSQFRRCTPSFMGFPLK